MTAMQRPRQPAERPLIRRDADGGERTAPSWESLNERLIREAQEAGHFDGLPGQGRPLELADDSLAGEKAMAHHILANAGAAPPWIEADKEIRDLRDRIDELIARAARSPAAAQARLERELDGLAEAHDAGVVRLDSLAPTSRQQRGRLDRDQARRRLREALNPAHTER